jgi:hypothetical protein
MKNSFNVNKYCTLLALVCFAPIVFAQGSNGSNDEVKGRNVHYVQCRDDKGHAQQYSQVSATQWAFFNKAGQSKSYAETDRDEWSVYLRNDAGLTVQLDLFQKTCTVRSAEGRVVSDRVAVALSL